jgi:N-methylhydantoinase A
MLLGVDVGGTFTDAVLLGRDGTMHTAKVPSTPAEQSRGVLAAVRAVLARAGAAPRAVERFAHGMTVATNALLEGRTARTALIATAGFTDVVELGRQARAHLYDLCRAAPPPLVAAELRFGAPERMTPDGVLRALQPDAARALVERLAADGPPEAVAVALLHSYAHPAHELLLGELLAQRLPATHVSLSHELVGTFREYERAASTEIDAALSPLLGTYLRRLSSESQEIGLPEPAIMQSSGGLIDAPGASAHAARTVLSGPAGGVRGAQLLAELAGERDVLCFDMGGTSCDVCLIQDGAVAETASGRVAGRPLALAMLDVHTVGAGGGSIAWRDAGGALRVGPRSAGADPGPACYGRGGTEPTVTDANVLLGRLPTALAGGLRLDVAAAERAIAGLAAALGLDTLRCAEGIVQVAESEMLRALRVMSVERGLDPRGFALMPFGGAGPLHAAALARALGMRRVLCPRSAGVLCALGLAAGAPRRDAARTVMLAGKELAAPRLNEERAALVARARAELGEQAAEVAVRYELRYRGQSFELAVQERALGAVDPAGLREAFAAAHERRYGYRDPDGEVELVTIRVSAWGAPPAVQLDAGAEQQPTREPQRLFWNGAALDGECLCGDPPPGTCVRGPAIYALGESTLLVPPGWEGEVDAFGTLRLRDTTAPGAAA